MSVPVASATDTKVEKLLQEIDRWMQQDPYGFQETLWEITKVIVDFATKTEQGFSETTPVGQAYAIWIALCAYVQKRLDATLLSLASDAWSAGKSSLDGRALHQAHLLLTATFSTMAVVGGASELETWATAVSETTTVPYDGMSQPDRETFFLAILESGAIKEARRASGILRAIATASDAKMIALTRIIAKHPRRVVPEF